LNLSGHQKGALNCVKALFATGKTRNALSASVKASEKPRCCLLEGAKVAPVHADKKGTGRERLLPAPNRTTGKQGLLE
jgi:hypothetical protein